MLPPTSEAQEEKSMEHHQYVEDIKQHSEPREEQVQRLIRRVQNIVLKHGDRSP